jgi:Neuraminidase (sialidase)
MKKYWVVTRTAQVWDEFRLYETTSEDDAIKQARDDEYFDYAQMVSEEIEYSRIAREDELDSETIRLRELI